MLESLCLATIADKWNCLSEICVNWTIMSNNIKPYIRVSLKRKPEFNES